MKNVVLYGGLAVGAYILYKIVEGLETEFTTNTIAPTAPVATNTNVSAPAGYITPNIQSQLLATATSNSSFSGSYLKNGQKLDANTWNVIYRLVVGIDPPGPFHDIYSAGDAYTYPLTLAEYAQEINDNISPLTSVQSISGLGLLAIKHPLHLRLGYR